MFLTLLIWISCFLSWTGLFALSESLSQKDKYFALFSFLCMCILIVIKLTLCKIKKKNIKKCILSTAIPILHYLFLICHSNIMYGYGNTMGIIGREEVIGLFSVINVSYNMAFILMVVIYAVLWLVMVLKYDANAGTITLPNNRITLTSIIIGVTVEIIGICIFIFTSELSILYVFSIAFFWIAKFITRLISFIIIELRDE